MLGNKSTEEKLEADFVKHDVIGQGGGGESSEKETPAPYWGEKREAHKKIMTSN